MTIKVAGMWELGWCAPLTEFDLWAFPLRDFGVAEWIMAPVSGVQKKVTEVAGIDAAIAANPELTVVFVDEDGATPLQEFRHPEDALYVLGRASSSPMRSFGAAHEHVSVRIETQEAKGLLWPHQAIAIVLYDRARKA
jgi:tRNA(Leu) C34 or U34 (ribose-2'-O)-methylase TrmL